MKNTVFSIAKFGAIAILVVFAAMVGIGIWDVINKFTKDWVPTGLAVLAFGVTSYVMYLWTRVAVDIVRSGKNSKKESSFMASVIFSDAIVVLFGVMFVAVDYAMNKFELFNTIDERVRFILFDSIWVLYVALIVATVVPAFMYRGLGKETETKHQIAELVSVLLCAIGNGLGTFHAIQPMAGWGIAIGMAVLNDFMIFVMIAYALYANDKETRSLSFKAAWVFIAVTSVVQIIGGLSYTNSISVNDIENYAWFSFPLMMVVSAALVIYVLYTDYIHGGLSFVEQKPQKPQMAQMPQNRPAMPPRPHTNGTDPN